MKENWRWEYDPDFQHVAGGLPSEVVAEVEHLVGQLVELADVGVDITDLGDGPRPGGLRRMDAAGGYFFFLPAPRSKLVVITRIVPPFASL
ncbi:hypothetical protein [Streptomyces rimosus]|uniref:hypothetical protein n=1 Tax=Streptomyces rimosus TaxID=1927 RepID=UPI0004CC4AA4|nr:hypothetical protein [Streptomyces rimosus]